LNLAELRFPVCEQKAKTADLTVVGGAGHVGVPLVLAFSAKELTVNINDIDQKALGALRSGRVPFIETGAQPLLDQALNHKRLFFTSHPSEISSDGPIIITIGTPVDELLNPVREVISECVESILPFLCEGQLLVLRSTLYPGTTDWIDARIKRKGRNIKVAFCPERIVQGNGLAELASMPQLISGTTPEAEAEAAALFGMIAPQLITLKPIEAEFAKLFNNAYRYVEFAIANQFYQIAKSAGLNFSRILQAMKENYPRAQNIPGPGFAAGPCLVKDTMQLMAFAQNEFALGNAAIMVNEGLPLRIVADLRCKYQLEKMTIGLLGMAFKAESDDPRASLSYKLKKALACVAQDVLTTDPYVTTDPELVPIDDMIARSDLLILCTPHRVYQTVDLKKKPVVDVWDFLKNANVL
jgi:UDP-N-acetyl-D-mannosaminuronic acid dehydrogenase